MNGKPPGQDGARGRKPSVPIGDLLVALAVLALGGWFLRGAFAVRLLSGYDRIGPRFFPLLVAGGLLLCGVLLLIQALRGRRAPLEATEEMDVRARADWRAVATLAAALVIDIVLIERLGFVIASTLLFWGVAFGFGSRHYLRDALSGLALALAAYLTFTRLLDLNLPAGLLPLALRALAGA
jgi:putative tricarboxylic transport membrane protein